MLGATYKLYLQKCRECNYNTKSNQCAWFEYPSVRSEIEAAKRVYEVGTPNCPRFTKKKGIPSPGAVSLAFGTHADKEDYYVEDIDE